MNQEFNLQIPLPFVEEPSENAQPDAQEAEETRAGITTPAANPPRSSILTLDEIRQMTPAEITVRWAEVAAILSNS